jgi:ribokinase
MLQLEIPMESVVHAAKIMNEKDGIVILDPAPAVQFPKQLLEYVDYITPNETEATILTSYTCNTECEIKKAALKLVAMGVPNVLI